MSLLCISQYLGNEPKGLVGLVLNVVHEDTVEAYRVKIAANFSSKNPSISFNANETKLVVLKGDGVDLEDSNAIAFYLVNKNLRCNDDPAKLSEILQWINFADNTILPSVYGWISSKKVSKGKQNNEKIVNAAKEDVLMSLNGLNKILLDKTFLVNDRITLADISMFTSLMPLYEHVFDSSLRKPYQNVNRWFKTVLNQPQVQTAVKNFSICNK